MANASAIVFSGIAPHPPIMVPEVGRDACAAVTSSIEAMAEFTRRLMESGAQTVVIISPHAPLDARAFVAYNAAELTGDFANFRAPDVKINFPLAEDLLTAISESCATEDYEVLPLENVSLDHGTLVPLYFLARNGWHGSVVALGYSFLSNDDHLKFGQCIRRAAERVGRPVAVVASGDLSHRLQPDAPAGFDPHAHQFDDAVLAAIRENQPAQIVEIDHGLLRMAGECGYRSMLVALGAINQMPAACEVLSYEAPFGVGYLVAQMTNSGARKSVDAELITRSITDLPQLARRAIETFTRTGKQISLPPEATNLKSTRAACFVSIKTKDGELRGCVGTVEPVSANLGEELIANAISAASRDPRFQPVEQKELDNLRYSVDIISSPEPAVFADLDPKVYGVIVEDEAGRRGLLLPDIAGVETARQQVDIAARKAGIPAGATMKMSRFRVDRFREKPLPDI
jgi:AmmeMemoRadiSam system protein A/AmmeMemoRadiSam system protein B